MSWGGEWGGEGYKYPVKAESEQTLGGHEDRVGEEAATRLTGTHTSVM